MATVGGEDLAWQRDLSPATLDFINHVAEEGRLGEGDPMMVFLFNHDGVACRLGHLQVEAVAAAEASIVQAALRGTALPGEVGNGLEARLIEHGSEVDERAALRGTALPGEVGTVWRPGSSSTAARSTSGVEAGRRGVAWAKKQDGVKGSTAPTIAAAGAEEELQGQRSSSVTASITRCAALGATAVLLTGVTRLADHSQHALAAVDYNLTAEDEPAVRVFEDATSSEVSVTDYERADGSVEERQEAVGSGFVCDRFGHVVTMLGKDKKFQIYEASIVGTDPCNDHVLKTCYALNNPYGFDHTLTVGVVSGLKRNIPSPTGRAIPGAIQTDAAINAGPLDSFGRVIGVNTATFTRQGTGMSSDANFAIPIDMVVKRVPRLIVDTALAAAIDS
eukprot:jgi/Chlat1/622/Chrsp103S01041